MAEDNALRRGYPTSRSYPDAGSRHAETDPLSELARLIGQTKHFSQPEPPRSNGHDHDWPGAPARALPADPAYHDDGQPYPPDDYQYAQHPAAYQQHSYDPQTDYGQGDAQAPYYGDNGQLAPDDPYAHHYQYEEQPRRRRGGLVTIAAVFCLALLGTAGAYAYRTFFNSGIPAIPPLIKAEAGPNKVAPAQPSGDTGGNKQIYDRVGSGAQAEKIVSREEQPVEVRPANARASYLPGNPNGSSSPQAAPAPQFGQAWPNPPGATVVPPGSPQAAEPRKVRTVTIRPDQGGGPPQVVPSTPPPAPQAPPPRAAAPVDTTPTAATPAAAPPALRQAPSRQPVHGPLSLSPQATERTASAEPRMAAPASSGGGYVVQLSAQKTEDEASAAFRAAQARYPQLLGSRQLLLKRKEIAGKGTFYGAQVGPFTSRDGANQLCDELKAAGGTCIVQKN